MTIYILALIASFALCYLMGSVIFGVIISRVFTGNDVRKSGSGNAGATNVARTIGLGAAVATFALDAIKCAVAILICKFLILVPIAKNVAVPELLDIEYMQYLLGFFAMLGHSYPIFFKFKGGKAVASSVGVMFCIDWKVAIFVLVIFCLAIILTHIVSLGSVLGAVQFVMVTFIYNSDKSILMHLYVTALSALVASLVILRHMENIKRLLKGEEAPTKIKKKSGGK